MVDKNTLRLRPVAESDAELLLEWRNDSVTRAQSIHQDEVTWEEHISWLKRSLESDSRWLYIAMVGERAVGTCRADSENGKFELSWAVAPKERGNGYGSEMVRQLSERHQPFFARVRKDNLASIRIAESLGLKPQDESAELLIFQ